MDIFTFPIPIPSLLSEITVDSQNRPYLHHSYIDVHFDILLANLEPIVQVLLC